MNMMSKPKIVLSVTAHPDDEVLGFGGTAAKLASEGHSVYNCILSGQVEARRYKPELIELNEDIKKAESILNCKGTILGAFPNIKFNTVPHLELVQFIENVIEELEPDFIFTHHPYDLNNDHYHVSKACQAAARLSQRKKTKPIKGLYFMEIPSSTDWAFSFGSNQFQPNTFIEIGDDNLNKKILALEAYRGVMRPYPHPRSREALSALATYRGAQAGINYAEAFQMIFQTSLL
jgi:LmbE family N-acetylglucosaminyl deacetylase